MGPEQAITTNERVQLEFLQIYTANERVWLEFLQICVESGGNSEEF